MDYEAAPFALASDEGERLVLGDVTVLPKASCETTGGTFTIFEEGPPLLDTPRHVHATRMRSSTSSKANTSWSAGGTEFFRLEPGGLIFLPRGVPHASTRRSA